MIATAHARRRSPLRPTAMALALAPALLLVACAGPEKKTPLPLISSEGGEAEPYDRSELADQRKTGFMLTELDNKIGIWTNLTLKGDPKKDLRTLNQIESAIRYEASSNAATLVDQLETGPPRNRTIAAAALGFAASDEALGPLLGALEDKEEEVVANALLGLSVLADPETPLTRVAGLLEDRSADMAVRNNAGQLLRSMPPSALEGPERGAILQAARFAIGDEEPQVRIHGLMLLARLEDGESLVDMASLLSDDVPLVAAAASRSVAYLGSVDGKLLGQATRALVSALDETRSRAFKTTLLADLQRLTDRNYGDDMKEWLRFANQLN